MPKSIRSLSPALVRWLSWLECPSLQQNVGLIPGQGTSLGCGFDPQWGGVWEATDPSLSHTGVSLLKINKHILGGGGI